MSDQPYRIVAEARSWIGTPFAHQGRKKGQGVDCLGLLIGVAAALRLRGCDGKLLVSRDSLAYGHYPDEVALREGLGRVLIPISEWEKKRGQQAKPFRHNCRNDSASRVQRVRHPGIIAGIMKSRALAWRAEVSRPERGQSKHNTPFPTMPVSADADDAPLPSSPPGERDTIPAIIGLFRIDGSARHLGIIAQDGPYPTLIHAYAPARKVVEHRFCEAWQGRLVQAYLICSCTSPLTPDPRKRPASLR